MVRVGQPPSGAPGAPAVGPVARDTSVHATPATATAGAHAPAAPLSTSTAADRARLTPHVGSAGSRAHDLRRGVPAELLAPYRPQLARLLESVALAQPSPELTATLTALVAHPHAEKIVASALTGRRLSKVDEAVVDGVRGLTVPRDVAARTLTTWHRQDATHAALSGHDSSLASRLEPALLAEPDVDRWQRALGVITELARAKNGSQRIVHVLTLAGVLGPDWRTAGPVPGRDALAPLLARRLDDPTAFDDPVAAARAEATLAARGLFDSPTWHHAKESSTQRGLLGEALRLATVEGALVAAPDHYAVQGVHVVRAPPELWALTTRDAAVAWCEAHGEHPLGLRRWVDEGGQSHWGLNVTELDVCVFAREPDGSERAVRFENVKAGVGTASKAAAQNDVALAGWTDPQVHYLFPTDGGPMREPRLDRTAEARAQIDTETVGPADDARYSASLPLSSHDITALAHKRGVL
jgi:hypothetical protein